jgi:hypothetical protein
MRRSILPLRESGHCACRADATVLRSRNASLEGQAAGIGRPRARTRQSLVVDVEYFGA